MAQNTGGSAAAWLAALLGLWVLVTPFFWGSSGGGGGGFNWLFWSNVVSGIIIAVVAAYAGFAGGDSSAESASGSSS